MAPTTSTANTGVAETTGNDLNPTLREHVRLLGDLLGEVIAADLGSGFVAKIERIRALAKQARDELTETSDPALWHPLRDYLQELSTDEQLAAARAFNQFLNLANIAEQSHATAVPEDEPQSVLLSGLQRLHNTLPTSAQERVSQGIAALDIDLVLTAHPTEVLRRTMIQKYDRIGQLLQELDLLGQRRSAAHLHQRRVIELRRLVSSAWHTDEIRTTRPTPVDEAKWGYAVIEQSLWHALPGVLRDLDSAYAAATHQDELAPSPLASRPIRFSAWMGGDRDGNPFVTADSTNEVLMLARWMSADLFLRDVEQLRAELSMPSAGAQVTQLLDDAAAHEPYRALLRELRDRLIATRSWAERLVLTDTTDPLVLRDNDDLLRPLRACRDSLVAAGLQDIANGALLDTIRRAESFGLTLVRLDIRQSSDRHAAALHDLTRTLQITNPAGAFYDDWSEDERVAFLLSELDNPRPLIPLGWVGEPETAEVLATCQQVVAHGNQAIGHYVISMAGTASDVLAVVVLLKACGARAAMPIVPLFETLADLDAAASVMQQLFDLPRYREYCAGYQQVMIGYSDSAKDAGQFAAAWAQYRAQEALTNLGHAASIKLTLFHGRGGAVGRGGGPAHEAILSLPPGALDFSLRVTEQGEVIRFKLGQEAQARQTLATYLTSVLEASLLPPPPPLDDWRQTLDRLAQTATSAYRRIVVDHPDFVAFFRSATPEQELGSLALGSRPARRAVTDDVASLRAIPWVFAWTQIRLMLPAWLGTDAALEAADQDDDTVIRTMYREWPFFRMQLDMLEMVLAKTEPSLVSYYFQTLAPEYLELADQLSTRRAAVMHDLLTTIDQDQLLANAPVLRRSLAVRNTYLDPLHVLQGLLLKAVRSGTSPDAPGAADDPARMALKITMAGISSGLRNTG